MAVAKQMSEQAFAEHYVVQVGERFSLKEESNGACVLLEGQAQCTVYQQRPQQCRDFPEWSCLRESDQAWQRAAEYCPGIHRLPSAEAWKQVVPLVQEVLEQADDEVSADEVAPCLNASGQWQGSSLEVDYFLTKFQPQPDQQQCPALKGQKCMADGYRPLICRALSTDAYLQASVALQQLAERLDYPWSKGDWLALLVDRATAWRQIAAKLPTLEV